MKVNAGYYQLAVCCGTVSLECNVYHAMRQQSYEMAGTSAREENWKQKRLQSIMVVVQW